MVDGNINCRLCHVTITPIFDTISKHCISRTHVEKSDKIASRHGNEISLGLRQNLIDTYMHV